MAHSEASDDVCKQTRGGRKSCSLILPTLHNLSTLLLGVTELRLTNMKDQTTNDDACLAEEYLYACGNFTLLLNFFSWNLDGSGWPDFNRTGYREPP